MTDNSKLILAFVGGALTVLFSPIAMLFCRATYWAACDAIDCFRYADLNHGRSKLNWLWIVPLIAKRSFVRTVVSEAQGIRRVG